MYLPNKDCDEIKFYSYWCDLAILSGPDRHSDKRLVARILG